MLHMYVCVYVNKLLLFCICVAHAFTYSNNYIEFFTYPLYAIQPQWFGDKGWGTGDGCCADSAIVVEWSPSELENGFNCDINN